MTFGSQAERDLESARQRERRALRGQPVFGDGPAGAQRGDADVRRHADDAFVVVDGRRDDAGDGGSMDLAVRASGCSATRLRASRTRPRRSG